MRYLILFITSLLVGCASGIPYQDSKNKIQVLSEGKGRIFVYRSSNPLEMLKPRVFTLNGQHVGDTFAGTVLYHDVKAGKHIVNYNGGRDSLTIHVPERGRVFLKYSIVSDTEAIGNTKIHLVTPAKGEPEILGKYLIETKIRNPDELKK